MPLSLLQGATEHFYTVLYQFATAKLTPIHHSGCSLLAVLQYRHQLALSVIASRMIYCDKFP